VGRAHGLAGSFYVAAPAVELLEEGGTVGVGARLAVVSDQQGGDGSEGEPAAQPAKAAQPEAAAAAEAAQPEPAPEAEARPEPEPEPEPRVEAEARPQPEPQRQPQRAPVSAPAATATDDGGGRPGGNGDGAQAGGSSPTGGMLLSPVVRKLLAEHDLDPSQVPGSGQEGRITRADVLAFIDRGAEGGAARQSPTPTAATATPAPAATATAAAPTAAAPTAAAPPPAPATATAKPAAAAAPGTDDEVVPFSNIRKRTAEHMTRSLATAAHVLTVTEVDFHAVDRVRRSASRDFKAREGFSLTYLPFVARAVIDAIADFPHVNSSVGDNELVVHRRVHLGIAVDLSFEGLIVPVARDADSKRLSAIARTFADLAARARSRDLTADDISGSTFTITNPGPFGTFLTAPIINQPQVGILSTDGVRKRPVAVELPDGGDAVAIHPVGNLALSFDHRAFDGAYAAAFLGRCKQILETRDWSQEL